MIILSRLLVCVLLALCVALVFPDWHWGLRAVLYFPLAMLLLWALREPD